MIKKIILFTGLMLLIGSQAYCAAKTSAGSGLWSAGATWVGGVKPAPGDTVTIAAGHTVTVDEEFDIGTNVANSTCLTINGTLYYPYDIDSGTWNFRGRVFPTAGQTPQSAWLIGTETTPVLSTNTINFIVEGAASGSFYIQPQTGVNPPIMKWYGSISSTNTLTAPISAVTTTRVTTSSNSVILDRDIDAKVGQEWAITGTEDAIHCEKLIVASYDSATSSVTFTSNFIYEHNAGAYLVNLSRNIIVKSTTTAVAGIGLYKDGSALYRDRNCNYDLRYVKFQSMGTATSSGFINAGWDGYMKGCVIDSCGRYYAIGSDVTIEDTIFYDGLHPFQVYSLATQACNGYTFNNCIFIRNSRTASRGIADITGSGFFTFTGCVFANSLQNILILASTGSRFENCVSQVLTAADFGTFATGQSFETTWINHEYKDVVYGARNTNNSPSRMVSIGGGSAYNVTAINHKPYATTPLLGTAGSYSVLSNYSTAGGEVRFQDFNNESNNNFIVSGNGVVCLESTTVRTAGMSGLKFDGIDLEARGVEYTGVTFTVNANYNDTILFRGFVKTSDTYGFSASSSPYVHLYDSGNDINTTVLATEDSKTDWELLSISGVMKSTGTVTIELKARLSGGCTAYYSDCRLYVGNNVYALGKDWVDGYPQASPVAQTVDSSNIWSETIYNGKDAKTILKEIRRREP